MRDWSTRGKSRTERKRERVDRRSILWAVVGSFGDGSCGKEAVACSIAPVFGVWCYRQYCYTYGRTAEGG